MLNVYFDKQGLAPTTRIVATSADDDTHGEFTLEMMDLTLEMMGFTPEMMENGGPEK